MSQLHEERSSLSAETLDLHRALSSLMEELEAVDWYQQRVDACADEALRSILAHNRDEEIEHAVMTLEWLRRKSRTWDAMLREYLFVEGDPLSDHAGARASTDATDKTDADADADADANADARGSDGLGVARALAAQQSKEDDVERSVGHRLAERERHRRVDPAAVILLEDRGA
ncbi:MAG: ferritin [Myxococcales bacterium]|nr:ferritin [Myxococcales bacterium]